MTAFIHGMGLISAQSTFGNTPLENPVEHASSKLLSVEPDYARWIDPKTIRRMSKIIRMGVTSAKLALKEAGIEKPDAIITGTGLGCLEDTENFLTKIIDNKEEALNPTPFIQSTHNTVGSQVALLTQCFGYNQTYTHRAFSFELALQDALMLLKENPDQHILTGSADEVTDLSMQVFGKFGWVKKSGNFSDEKNPGTLHGEGAAFFVLTGSKKNAWAELMDVGMIYKPQHANRVITFVHEFLSENKLKNSEIDLVLTGMCGDEKYDALMKDALTSLQLTDKNMSFKNFCGEYSTASSFAVWMATMILKQQNMQKPIRNILIYNQYFNQHHTLILLKAC